MMLCFPGFKGSISVKWKFLNFWECSTCSKILSPPISAIKSRTHCINILWVIPTVLLEYRCPLDIVLFSVVAPGISLPPHHLASLSSNLSTPSLLHLLRGWTVVQFVPFFLFSSLVCLDKKKEKEKGESCQPLCRLPLRLPASDERNSGMERRGLSSRGLAEGLHPPGFLSSRPPEALIHYHFTLMAFGNGRLFIPYSCPSFVVLEGVGESVCLPFCPLSAFAVLPCYTSRRTSPTIDWFFFYWASQMGGRDDSPCLMWW